MASASSSSSHKHAAERAAADVERALDSEDDFAPCTTAGKARLRDKVKEEQKRSAGVRRVMAARAAGEVLKTDARGNESCRMEDDGDAAADTHIEAVDGNFVMPDAKTPLKAEDEAPDALELAERRGRERAKRSQGGFADDLSGSGSDADSPISSSQSSAASSNWAPPAGRGGRAQQQQQQQQQAQAHLHQLQDKVRVGIAVLDKLKDDTRKMQSKAVKGRELLVAQNVLKETAEEAAATAGRECAELRGACKRALEELEQLESASKRAKAELGTDEDGVLLRDAIGIGVRAPPNPRCWHWWAQGPGLTPRPDPAPAPPAQELAEGHAGPRGLAETEVEYTDRMLQLRLNTLVNRGVDTAAAHVIVTRQSEKVYTVRLPGAPPWVGNGGWGGAEAATGGGWGPTPRWTDRADAQAAAAAAAEVLEVEAREVSGNLMPRQLEELDEEELRARQLEALTEEELRAEVRHLTTVLAAGFSLLQHVSRPPPSRAGGGGGA